MKRINKKGQALVEFIIIVPVLIMLILSVVDFGKIFSTKSDLEASMSKVVSMYESGNDYNEIKAYLDSNLSDCELKINNDNKYIKFEIGKNVDIFTPGLNLILGNPYKVSIQRTLPYE